MWHDPLIESFVIIVSLIGGIASSLDLYLHGRDNIKDEEKGPVSVKAIVVPLLILIICVPIVIYYTAHSKAYIIARNHWGELKDGLWMTIRVSVASILFGTGLGILSALFITRGGKRNSNTLYGSGVRGIVYILLSVPALVLLYIVYFFSHINSVLVVSILALSINLTPFVGKIVANSIDNISEDQINAATAFGYSRWQIAMNFKIGYVLRNSLQPLLVEYYTTIKFSSLAGFIGLTESFHVSQDIIKETQDPISGYIILTCCYIILVMPLAIIADHFERKWKSKQFG